MALHRSYTEKVELKNLWKTSGNQEPSVLWFFDILRMSKNQKPRRFWVRFPDEVLERFQVCHLSCVMCHVCLSVCLCVCLSETKIWSVCPVWIFGVLGNCDIQTHRQTHRHTWHMAHDTWHMTHDTWHMTHDTWHMTHDTWHMTHDTWHITHLEPLKNLVGEPGTFQEPHSKPPRFLILWHS